MKRIAFFLTLLFLFQFSVQAGEIVLLAKADKSTLQAGSTLNLEDLLYPDEQGNPAAFGVEQRMSKVRLFYSRDLQTDVLGSGDWTYKVTYTLHDLDNPQNTLTNQELEINFLGAMEESSGYEALNLHNLGSARVKVEVTGVQSTGPVPVDIYLELQLHTERYADLSNLDLNRAPDLKFEASTSTLSWTFAEGDEEYEAEWIFVDKENSTDYAASDPVALFEDYAATRIRTPFNHYEMDLVFPQGKLWFRVRSIGRFVNSNGFEALKYSPWGYYNANGGTVSYDMPSLQNAFEAGLNWQYVSSFAEDGKHKAVISYLDGTQRNRQVQTYLNSDRTTLVEETKYDSEGRPAVQILPVPTKISGNFGLSLTYKAKFNQAVGGDAFEAEHFENGAFQVLDDGSGAARYYSSQNEFLSGGAEFNRYIPKANGYAYTQVEYTRDQTGRQVVAGGVGNTHRMGGGREIRTWYATPSSTELHRLFGTNVGKASHYKKVITQDPNKQKSVTYLDQEGRTIATGLIGAAPSELLSLGHTAFAMKHSLNSGNVSRPEDGTLISTSRIFNPELDIPHSFSYDMEGLLFDFTSNLHINSGSWDFCVECKYELEIRLEDPDGLPVYTQVSDANGVLSPAATSHTLNIQGGFVNPDCSTTSYPFGSITINPTNSGGATIPFEKIGVYTLEKKLKVDDSDLETQLQLALNDAGLGSSYLTALESQFEGYFGENWCTDDLGDLCEEYLVSTGMDPQDPGFNAAVAACQDDFISTRLAGAQQNSCEGIKEMMMDQVSPGGFHHNESLNASGGFWDRVADGMSNQLTTCDGTNIHIQFREYDGNGNPVVMSQQPSLNDLKTATSFDDHPLWAEDLLPAHREYCLYDSHCLQPVLRASDPQMALIKDWSEAESTGWLDALGFRASNMNPFGIDYDIYYNNINQDGAITGTETDEWLNHISQTDWNNLWAQLNNINGSGLNLWHYAYNQAAANGYTIDEVRWMVFRGMYLHHKEQMLTGNFTYYDDHFSIFREPLDANLTALQAGLTSNLNSVSLGCPEICEQNVTKWMDSLVVHCNLDPANTAAWLAVKAVLEQHCLDNCDASNPFGVIYDTFVSTLHGAIMAAASGTGWSPDPTELTDCLNLIVYSNPYNSSGVNTSLQLISPCLNGTIIPLLNEHVLPNSVSSFTISQASMDVSCLGYYTTLGVNAGNNTIELCQLSSSCCLYKIYDENAVAEEIEDVVEIINVQVPTIPPQYSVFLFLYSGLEITYMTDEGLIKTGFLFHSQESCLSLFDNTTTYSIPTEFDLPTYTTHILPCNPVEEAHFLAKKYYQLKVDAFASEFRAAYLANCLPEGDNLCYQAPYEEHHFTLYYFDQAGSLVQTVPPQGFRPVPNGSFDVHGVHNGDEPEHRMVTQYRFNSLDQVSRQESPDGGVAHFWYNDKSQVVLSQDARQAESYVDNGQTYVRYSYTLYDEQERIIEVGEVEVPKSDELLGKTEADLDVILNHPNLVRTSVIIPGNSFAITGTFEVTHTYYEGDLTANNQIYSQQEHLRSRVSSSTFEAVKDGNPNTYDHGTHYSYDPLGNVHTLWQEFADLKDILEDVKRVDYEYDLISGNVNEVIYQEHQLDEYRHRYCYDADNRLTAVQTSTTGHIWDTDAKYYYYPHGPLARVETGQDKVQAMDYAYNLQGWLKAVNAEALYPEHDQGHDGQCSNGYNRHRWVGRDAYGYGLSYHQGDYDPIATLTASEDFQATPSGMLADANHDLYNGNISRMTTAMSDFSENPLEVLAFQYKYDQLNRLRWSESHRKTMGQNLDWTNPTTDNSWNVNLQYDGNGNITSLKRNGDAATGLAMDFFTYRYKDYQGDRLNNRLYHIDDGHNSVYNTDIDDQGNFIAYVPNQGTSFEDLNNYGYDPSGNLVRDNAEGIEAITWSVYGKVLDVKRESGSDDADLSFTYGPMGNRVTKHVKPRTGTGYNYKPDTEWEKTYYVRDAQGQILATYHRQYHYLGFLTEAVGTTSIQVTSPTGEGTGTVMLSVDGTDILSEGVAWMGSASLTAQAMAAAINASSQADFSAQASGDRIDLSGDPGTGAVLNGVTIEYTGSGADWGLDGEATFVGGVAPGHNYTDELRLNEWHLYGSQRLGVHDANEVVKKATFIGDDGTGYVSTFSNPPTVDLWPYFIQLDRPAEREAGEKNYELANHLGNVLEVVTDRKLCSPDPGCSNALVYAANVVSYTDYYPFGSPMPGRNGVAPSGDYRFGFNGQEQDDEWQGKGNSLNYKFRMNDTRLARFFAEDPITKDYPMLTPYQHSSLNPIWNIELEGLEGEPYTKKFEYFGKIHFNTMVLGAEFDFFGLPVGFKYDFGGGTQELDLRFSIDENGVVDLKFTHTQVWTETGGFGLGLGIYGREESSAKEMKTSISLQEGFVQTEDKKFQDKEKTSLFIFAADENEKITLTENASGEVNLFLVGVGVDAGIQFVAEPKKKP